MESKKLQYKLYIPFNLESYTQLDIQEKLIFEYNNKEFKINRKGENKYYICLKPFYTEKEAEEFFEQIKISLKIFSLNNPGIAIKIYEKINKTTKLDQPIHVKQMNMKYICDINEAAIIPITDDVYSVENETVKFNSTISSELFEKNIKESFNYNLLKISSDKKLESALELYSKNKQFSNTTQFINLIIILEILSERKNVSEKEIEIIEKIKNYTKRVIEKHNEESIENIDENKYLSKIGDFKRISITQSLIELSEKFSLNTIDPNLLESKIKESYDIRSKLVHDGKIKDKKEFNNNFIFLENFVKEIIKIKIKEYKN